MIKNVILDLGNVCVTFQPETYFYAQYQEDTKRLCHKLFRSKIWSDYDQGLVNKADLYTLVAHDEDVASLCKMIDEWSSLLKKIPETMICIKALKAKGYQVYILSNTSKEGAETCLALDEAFQLLDGGVYSYEVKVNKPDVEIYETLLNKYQLKAEECIFLDDKEENIDTAKKLGMHGLVCGDVRTCIFELWKQLEEIK